MVKILRKTTFNGIAYEAGQTVSLALETEARWCRNGIAEAAKKADAPKEKAPMGEKPKVEFAKEGLPPESK